jgi:FkbM family methyltransferase
MSTTNHPSQQGLDLAAAIQVLSHRIQGLTDAVSALSLGPDRVFTFAYADTLVRMHLPFAPRDVVQGQILRHGGFYETPQLAEIRPMIPPGAVIADIGANIGNHAVFFALLCGAARIHAFEPMRVTSGILRRNLALNGIEDCVTVHDVALGPASGTAALLRYPSGNIGAAAVDPARPGAYRVEPLDAFGLERLDFVKMDVEGGFVGALEGAAGTLARCRPPVWIELRERQNEIEPGTAALAKLGYRHARRIAGSRNDHLFLPE